MKKVQLSANFSTPGAVSSKETAVSNLVDMLATGGMPFSKQKHNAYGFDSNNFRHTFWLLPGVVECEALASMLRKHTAFQHYEIIVAAGKNEKVDSNTLRMVKEKIGLVDGGKHPSKKDGKLKIGTITLSCGKLTHGVSIPEWGSVLMLSDTKSAQEWYQSIFV